MASNNTVPVSSANNGNSVQVTNIKSEYYANIAKEYAQQAEQYCEDVQEYADAAKTELTQIKNAAISEMSSEADEKVLLAQSWAVKMDGIVNGEDYSSKYYAQQSQSSAETAESLLTEVETAHSDALQAISTAQTTAVGAVDTAKTAALNDISTQKNSAINDINSEKSTVISTIETAENEAVTEITSKHTTAVNEIEQDRSDAVGEISGLKTSAVNEISGYVTEAENWATKMDAPVEDSLYSAKYYAQQASDIVAGGVSQATENILGGAKIATAADMTTGTDDTKIVTPLKANSFVSGKLADYVTTSDLMDCLISKANTDFSNLPPAGEKHFLNKTQLTNCILEAPNGVATYSGTTITLKQGLKVLVPNGRNADGSLKNIEYVLSADTSYNAAVESLTSYTRNIIIFVGSNNMAVSSLSDNIPLYYQETQPSKFFAGFAYWYNTAENKVYYSNGNSVFTESLAIIIGSYTINSSAITTLKTDKAVNLLKYSDLSWLTSLSLPSDKKVTLSIPGSNVGFRAVDDGYVQFHNEPGSAVTSGVYNQSSGLSFYTNAPFYEGFVPVKKGDTVSVYYGKLQKGVLRFIYATGAQE